jgi:hypothetical protein
MQKPLNRNLVIGIDPDSKQYGVSVWRDGKLTALRAIDTVQLWEFFQHVDPDENPTIAIEDVKTNSFMYGRNMKGGPSVVAKIAQGVGMCKHAQTVAEQFIEHNGFNLVRVSPQKGNWAKDQKQFEQLTGWTGRSNEDTRSAAFIGFLGYQQIRQEEIKRAIDAKKV